jgi:hypothetical protein
VPTWDRGAGSLDIARWLVDYLRTLYQLQRLISVELEKTEKVGMAFLKVLSKHTCRKTEENRVKKTG